MNNEQNNNSEPMPVGWTQQADDPAIPMPVAIGHGRSKIVIVITVLLAIGLGLLVGFTLAGQNSLTSIRSKITSTAQSVNSERSDNNAATPSLSPQDLRDSSVGTIQIKPVSQTQKQGSHILKRDDAPWPIYLTSSFIDLSQYEGKHVKIYGVTYDGGSNDWYMEVNKVDIQ